ncbi:MAG: matrixin family metalloprotease [Nitrosopumilus sp.]
MRKKIHEYFSWCGDFSFRCHNNIAAHKIGHVTGMGHPTDDCTEETMYRFAGAGETKKRDLNTRDITGIQRLY